MRVKIGDHERGAALILEVIIYLVVVALIAVAAISGVRAIRDLIFTSHAKSDIQNVQTWAEGRYIQDNRYPNGIVFEAARAATNTSPAVAAGGYSGAPRPSEVNGDVNTSKMRATGNDYCIQVISNSMSDTNKNKFWLASNNPSKIYQSGTRSNNELLTAPTKDMIGMDMTCP